MVIEASGHASASERIPPALALQLVDLMAQQKMLPETRHMLELCHLNDTVIVVGSDIQIRLQILSIDEGLNQALDPEIQDPENPPKYFERLLGRFDDLVSVYLSVNLSLGHSAQTSLTPMVQSTYVPGVYSS